MLASSDRCDSRSDGILMLATVSFEEFEVGVESHVCSLCKPTKDASMAKLFRSNPL